MSTLRQRRARRLWWFATVLPVLISILTCGSALAQAAITTLTVSLHDLNDQPVVAATVRVIDAGTLQPLASADTDGAGQAILPHLPTRAVRVLVEGALPDGTTLQFIGEDATGIRVTLPSSPWLMALRVDTDGTVVPDLGITGAGAADGDDHAAIADGSFFQPTAVASALPSAPLPSAAPTPTSFVAASGGEAMSPADEIGVALAVIVLLTTVVGAIIVLGRRP